MIAGPYDFIEEYRNEFGDEVVDTLLDSGYEPFYIPGEGWSWQVISSTPISRNTSSIPFTPVNLIMHID